MKKYIYFLIICITVFFSLIENSYAVNPIAYWSFDDSTASDNSGNGYHGKIVNNPTPAIGVKGSCFRFVGKNKFIEESENKSLIGDHILIPRIPLENYSEFTISMWVNEEKLEFVGGSGYFFIGEVFNAWAGIYHAGHFPDPTLWIKFSSGANNDEDEPIKLTYDNSFNNRWIYYTLVYQKGILYAFINGKLIEKKYQPLMISGNRAGISTNYWYYASEHRQSAAFTGKIDEVKIYDRALTPEEIEQEFSKCNTWLDYPRFTNAGGLSFGGKALIETQAVKLTGNTEFESGSLWSIRPIPVNDNFTSEFSFKFTEGINDGNHDGSYPGADGLAFVIQGRGYEALGDVGGGIGYDNLDNGIAIEFDTFRNEYDYYKDSTGNHVALQVSSGNKLRAKHSPDYTKAINHNIFEMKNFETYYSRVEYDYAMKELKVYLDKQLPYDTLVIDYAPLDLPKILNTTKDLAYFGFTAATGISRENHFILSWNLCSNALPSGVEESGNAEEISALSPNPAVESIEIQLEESDLAIQSIDIYDYLGIKVNELKLSELQINKNSIKLPVVGLPKGVYFIKVTGSIKNYFGKFIKI